MIFNVLRGQLGKYNVGYNTCTSKRTGKKRRGGDEAVVNLFASTALARKLIFIAMVSLLSTDTGTLFTLDSMYTFASINGHLQRKRFCWSSQHREGAHRQLDLRPLIYGILPKINNCANHINMDIAAEQHMRSKGCSV